MASSRPDGSFYVLRGYSAGGNVRTPMEILQQHQRHQNALPTGRLPGTERPAQGIPLPGTVYAVQSQAIPSGALPNTSANVAYLHPLQGSHLYPTLYAGFPLYAQVIPTPDRNNTQQTVGSGNQLINNSQHKSVVGETSRSRDEDVEADSCRFGLRGLRDILNGRDSNVTALAVGRDKDSLNAYDNMYCTYNFPWSAKKPNTLPHYKLPNCYLRQVPRLDFLQPHHISKLKKETLFYIFYSTPNDEAQLLAANELHNRGWVYHKQLRVWLTRSESDQPTIKRNTYEKGSYVYFDPHTWKYVEKENFTLFYNSVERKPSLPPRKEKQL